MLRSSKDILLAQEVGAQSLRILSRRSEYDEKHLMFFGLQNIFIAGLLQESHAAYLLELALLSEYESI